MIQQAAPSLPVRLNTLLAGLLCLLFAGLGDLAVAQDINKIAKGPRRLVKKLAEDLAKDGLEDPYSEAMRVFRLMDPADKELADLQSKTQKTLFKTRKKPKTKRLAKHRENCGSLALKVAALIERNPDAESALAEIALALDHTCEVAHQRIGNVKGKDGVWRSPRAQELQQKWQAWGRERFVIANREVEIEEKMAPNWTRVSVGQNAKGFVLGSIHLAGTQRPSLLKQRLTSLVQSLQLVNYFAVGNSQQVGSEIQHLCVGTSAKDYEKALKILEEHRLVTFGDLANELKFKNGCFFGYSVDRLDQEKNWLNPVLTSALHDRWKIGIYPNWFSVGLSNYVQLMLQDVGEEMPEGPITRPAGLIQRVDQPVAEMMRNRKLKHFETLSFTPAAEMTPREIALATSLVEFILLTSDDAMAFQQRYQKAATSALEAGARPQSFDWEKMLSTALDRLFNEFEADWLGWLNSGEGQSLKSLLADS
jgi:hypothetical protein